MSISSKVIQNYGESMTVDSAAAKGFISPINKNDSDIRSSLAPGVKLGDRIYDVTTHCSCPDWANPCKHSLAVLMLLGEEAEFRPLILLELRGIREAELYDKD